MSKSNVKSRVKQLLQEDISLADNDNELIYRFFEKYCYILGHRPLVFVDWFRINMNLCNTITRCRRTIEKQCPELRGKGYNKRHNILEPEFREKVKNDKL